MTGYPLGLRNNNPGNLRAGDQWQGMIGQSQGFIQFQDLSWGLRALAIDLRTKINEGYDTIALIIDRYAPMSDNNDTEAYIQAVSDSAHLSRDKRLEANSATIAALMRGIIDVEIGTQYAGLISSADINEGISMAGMPIPVGQIGFGIASALFLVAVGLLITAPRMPKQKRA